MTYYGIIRKTTGRSDKELIMKKSIKRLSVSLLSLMILLITLMPVFAAKGPEGLQSQMERGWKSQEERIDVRVDLDEDGTAHVKEYWGVDIKDNWSELFIPMTHMNGMKIENLKVKNVSTDAEYTTVEGNWDSYSNEKDTDRKRELKNRKCGLSRISGGNEICWGVDNSGYNVYELDYDLTNAVKKYSDDKVGFHIRFVNSDMNINNLSAVTVVIGMSDGKALTKGNTKVWAFGLEGDIQVQNGEIVCRSESGGRIDFCNVMAEIKPSLFNEDKLYKTRASFKNVEKEAKKGSDYSTEKPSLLKRILNFFLRNILLFVILIPIFISILADRTVPGGAGTDTIYTGNMKPEEIKNKDYTRDIPMHGSKEAAVTAINSMHSSQPLKENIFAAYLLHFLQIGVLKSFSGEKKKNSYLILQKETVEKEKEKYIKTESEEALYKILLETAEYGESDAEGTITPKDMKSYGKKNVDVISRWYKLVQREGKQEIIDFGYTEKIIGKKGFKKATVDALNEEGRKEAAKFEGLENFFRDFTLLNERQMSDVGLWKDYLVYATLFGMTKKVAKEMDKLIPDYFEHPERYGYSPGAFYGGYEFFDFYIISSFASDYNYGLRAQAGDSRSFGGGGFTSVGGGGGFSGGGSGGGGR